jgi:hypothetical protein
MADLEVRYMRLRPGSFTVRIPWDIPGFSVNIVLTQHTLNRLAEFGVPAPVLNLLTPLLNEEFEVIEKFFEALQEVDNPGEVQPYRDVILRECFFTDKYARFNISPRGQIKTIVDRVKAAGVYAVIAFEKRFFEDQQLAEQLGLVIKRQPYDQEMSESNFDLASTQAAIEHQEMSDFFSASGVFDYTGFDSLNTFA